jgi:hypothetical protein
MVGAVPLPRQAQPDGDDDARFDGSEGVLAGSLYGGFWIQGLGSTSTTR